MDTLQDIQPCIRQRMMEVFLEGSDAFHLQTESEHILNHATSLLSTERFIKRLRARKTARLSLSLVEEREALCRARSASRDVRAIVGSHLRITRHLLATGGSERLLAEFKRMIAEHPEITVADLWTSASEADGTAKLFTDRGIDMGAFRQMDEAIRRITLRFRVIDDQLTVERPRRQDEWLPVVARQANDHSTADLLWKLDNIDIALAALEHPGPFGMEVITLRKEPESTGMVVCDLSVLQAIESTRIVLDADSFVCLLEEAGLPVFSGRDPWVCLAVLGAVVLAVALTVTIVCFAKGDWEAGKFKTKVCDVASWLCWVGLGVMVGSLFMSGDPNTQVCVNGTCYRNRNELFPEDPAIK